MLLHTVKGARVHLRGEGEGGVGLKIEKFLKICFFFLEGPLLARGGGRTCRGHHHRVPGQGESEGAPCHLKWKES